MKIKEPWRRPQMCTAAKYPCHDGCFGWRSILFSAYPRNPATLSKTALVQKVLELHLAGNDTFESCCWCPSTQTVRLQYYTWRDCFPLYPCCASYTSSWRIKRTSLKNESYTASKHTQHGKEPSTPLSGAACSDIRLFRYSGSIAFEVTPPTRWRPDIVSLSRPEVNFMYLMEMETYRTPNTV